MPIYEYECSKCGVFDVMQKITANPLRKCPTCKRKVTKLMSNTAFQLKGSGWYITDYGRKGNSGSGTSDSGSESGASSSSETSSSTESKSESKSKSSGKKGKKSSKGSSANAA